MYRLPLTVTTRAATPRGWAWGCGRRGAHHRAGPGLPRLGPGWAGGLGLGLGLALGVKLAGALRGAAPAAPPAAPDPEASPQAEQPPPREQPLAPRSPQTPTASTPRRYARAIDSSRDLLHRIKVRRRGALAVGTPEGGPSGVIYPGRADPSLGDGMPTVSSRERLPVSRPPGHSQTLLGGCPIRGGGHGPPWGPPLPFRGANTAHLSG